MGYGVGRGRGGGRGGGRGMGMKRFAATGMYPQPQATPQTQAASGSDLEKLKDRITKLQKQLERIEERLDELEK
jgi:hypothetical protein